MKKCPNCNTENDPDRILCSKCERPIVNVESPARAVTVQETSVDALESVREIASGIRARVMSFIKDRGDHGATDQEIQDALGLGAQTQTPSRRNLAKRGEVVDSGEKRLTRSGRKAIVWIDSALVEF